MNPFYNVIYNGKEYRSLRVKMTPRLPLYFTPVLKKRPYFTVGVLDDNIFFLELCINEGHRKMTL